MSRRTYFFPRRYVARRRAGHRRRALLAIGQAVERATGGWGMNMGDLVRFFTTISAVGVTAALAVATAALLAGGFATIRRLTV